MGDGANTAQLEDRVVAGRDWARALGEICAVLAQAPGGTVTQVGATVRLDGRADELRQLLDLCRELGRRHDADHTVRRVGAHAAYTVSFSRRADRSQAARR